MRRALVAVSFVLLPALLSPASAQDPSLPPELMDTPGVRVLKGLNVSEFETEMQLMVEALGVNCAYCHVRGNFASDANPRKETARRMVEMTKGINQQFFPDYKPAAGESRLGRVTCYTCHQGAEKPSRQPGGAANHAIR